MTSGTSNGLAIYGDRAIVLQDDRVDLVRGDQSLPAHVAERRMRRIVTGNIAGARARSR